MHSEFSGRNWSVDFISTSVNEGYYMKMFWNFPESIVEVNAVVRHFRHPWVLIRNIWQYSETILRFNNRYLLVVVNG
jgi:hypothetical protein